MRHRYYFSCVVNGSGVNFAPFFFLVWLCLWQCADRGDSALLGIHVIFFNSPIRKSRRPIIITVVILASALITYSRTSVAQTAFGVVGWCDGPG